MLAPIVGFVAEIGYERLSRRGRWITVAIVWLLLAGCAVASFSDWSLVGVLPDHVWFAATAASMAMIIWRVRRFEPKAIRWASVATALLLFANIEFLGHVLIMLGGFQHEHGRCGWVGLSHTYDVQCSGGALMKRDVFCVYLSSVPVWCPVVERRCGKVLLPWGKESPDDLTVSLGERDGARVAEIRIAGEVREVVPLL